MFKVCLCTIHIPSTVEVDGFDEAAGELGGHLDAV